MDALLILGGLLLILAGLVWLVVRAFETSLLWGWGSLIPPLTLIYVLRHWRSARQAVFLAALGCIPLIVGLAILANHDPQRLEAILGLQWLEPQMPSSDGLAIELHGELNGQPFAPRHGELVKGVLVLREGQDFFASRELRIRLPQLVEPGKGVRLDVMPGDTGDLPEVEVNWLLPEQDLPEARRLGRGYTLHLNLRPQAPNTLGGDFHLVLPAQLRTSLSGTVELYSDNLRYRDGKVDRTFDSADTLAFVVEDYLRRRFAPRDVRLAGLPPVDLPADNLDLAIEAKVDGMTQRLAVVLDKTPGQGWGVRGDRYPALAEPPATVARRPPGGSGTPPVGKTEARPEGRQGFSLGALLLDPEGYRNRAMRVSTRRGGLAEGRFQGVDGQGNLILDRRLGEQGVASFTLAPDDVGRIELLEP